MDIIKNITQEGEVTLEVVIPKEETGDTFIEALRDFQSQASIPGFRPGKVPLNHIRQRWGKAIMMDKAEEIAKKRLPDILKEQDLTPGGRIDINLVDYGEDKPLKFKAEFPLQPVVKLDMYKGLEVTINDAEVTDEDVAAQIEGIRHKHAMMRSVDTPATAQSKLTLKVQEVDSSGLSLIGRKVEEIEYEFGTDKLGIGSDEQLLGIKAGEKRIIRTREQMASIIQSPSSQSSNRQGSGNSGVLQNREATYSVEVLKIEEEELPEVDMNLVKQVNNNLKSLDEFRNYVKLNLMDFVASNAHSDLERKVVDRVVEVNKFPVAKSVIKSTLEEIANGLRLDEQRREKFFEEHFAETEKDYRWVRLREEIGKIEGIEVTDEELNTSIEQIAKLSKADGDEIRKRYTNTEERERLRRRHFESKVIEILITNAKVEKRKLTLREYFDAVRAES